MTLKDLVLDESSTVKYKGVETVLWKLLYHGAEMLAGSKASTMISFRNSKCGLRKLWDTHKHEISGYTEPKYIELKRNEKGVVVLFYWTAELEKILEDTSVRAFLSRFGYTDFSIQGALHMLKERFDASCPHEVGVFLGYPLEDVIHFTDCPKEKCIFTGYWKVFCNAEQAKQTFKLYDQIKSDCAKMLHSGLMPSQVIKNLSPVH